MTLTENQQRIIEELAVIYLSADKEHGFEHLPSLVDAEPSELDALLRKLSNGEC